MLGSRQNPRIPKSLSMIEKIQVGLDIATSVSILGAAISFLVSQKKARDQSRAQYSTSNLIRFLDEIKIFSKQYDDIGNQLRSSSYKEALDKALDKNILDTIFFLESVKREIERQNQMYFPLFSINDKTSDELSLREKELDGLIEKAKKGREAFVEVTAEVEPMLRAIERTVVGELKKIMKAG